MSKNTNNSKTDEKDKSSEKSNNSAQKSKNEKKPADKPENKKTADKSEANEKKSESNAKNKTAEKKKTSENAHKEKKSDTVTKTDKKTENKGDGKNAAAEEKKPITFNEIKKKAGYFFDKIGLPDMLLSRLIALFFFFSTFNAVTLMNDDINPINNWQQFIPELSLAATFFYILGGFVVLSIIYMILPKNFRFSDPTLAIASIIYFNIEILWRANNMYLGFSFMFVSLIFIYYALSKVKPKKMYEKIPWWVCGIIVLLIAGLVCFFVALTSVCRHQNFGTSTHDFGLFVQMFHSMSNNMTAVTSCERDEFLSHFYIHASYIFYALVPFYKMFPYAETLIIAQAILAMGGIIPMFLIAKRHNMKGVTLIFMCLAYVFCIGLIGPCYYDFHENCFLPTLLMWLLWAVDGKKYIMFYIMSVLVCIVKEDAPLYVICIGMFMVFEHKGLWSKVHGILMSVISCVYMFIITDWLVKNGDGQMMTSSRFGNLMIDYEGGLKEVVKNVLTDPAYFFSLFIHEDTIPFFLQVLVPMLFLPFFTKKLYRFMLMIPFVIMNMVIGAGYGYAASVGYQYIFGPAALLLYMCIINLDDLSQAKKQDLPILLGTAAMITTIASYSHNISYYESHINDVTGYFDELEAMLDRIPKEGSVLCDTFLLPHIANRDEVYIFDNNDYNFDEGCLINPDRYEYFVVPVGTELYNACKPEFDRLGFTMIDQVQGRIEVYENPNYVPAQ